MEKNQRRAPEISPRNSYGTPRSPHRSVSSLSEKVRPQGVSARRISSEAGVSVGLINHHFPNKSGFIGETHGSNRDNLVDFT